MHNETVLRKQFLAHVGQTSPSPMLIEVERAEGTFFYTPEGRRTDNPRNLASLRRLGL